MDLSRKAVAILKGTNFFPLLGGLIFLLVFHWAYSNIDNYLYECRDDGVITMSAARNFVDFGFVGVNPSGPIVEVTSSPVQFVIYAISYWITGVSYTDFAWWQTFFATFFIGALFGRYFVTTRHLKNT